MQNVAKIESEKIIEMRENQLQGKRFNIERVKISSNDYHELHQNS